MYGLSFIVMAEWAIATGLGPAGGPAIHVFLTDRLRDDGGRVFARNHM